MESRSFNVQELVLEIGRLHMIVNAQAEVIAALQAKVTELTPKPKRVKLDATP